jgi:predicted ABC-type ATPase
LPDRLAPPTLAIIAGPNGSGKSTFFNLFLQGAFSVFVNADEIAKKLSDTQESSRALLSADVAEERRNQLIEQATSFAFETVFSRTDYWIDFIRRAKTCGFIVCLYFLCTEDSALNVGRVATRVAEGGHPVPIDKSQSRYPGSIRTAVRAVVLARSLDATLSSAGRNEFEPLTPFVCAVEFIR